MVDDLMGHFPCRLLTGTAEWFSSHPGCHADEVIEVGQEELSRVSLQKTPQEVLAIFEQPVYESDSKVISKSLCLALDNIQDPGNLGTIIRLADWFGIEDIFALPERWMSLILKLCRLPWGNSTSESALL